MSGEDQIQAQRTFDLRSGEAEWLAFRFCSFYHVVDALWATLEIRRDSANPDAGWLMAARPRYEDSPGIG